MPIRSPNLDGPLSLDYRKKPCITWQAGSNPAQPGNRLTNQSRSLSVIIFRAESRRLSNSMVEFRPRAGVAGSTPASDAISCPMQFWWPCASTFDGSQDWVIVHNDVVAGSSPAFGSRCRSSSVVEHVFPVRLLSVGHFKRAVDCGLSDAVGWRFESAFAFRRE